MYRIFQISVLVFMLAGISGCAYAQDVNSDSPIAEAIAILEENGTYPGLDRSNTFSDADQNGVRDDIDKYIDGLSERAEVKTNLRQLAEAIQFTLVVDVADRDAVDAAKQNLILGYECVTKAVGDLRASRSLGLKVKAYTANTKKRTLAALNFSKALNGHVLSLINDPVCDGDVYRPPSDRKIPKPAPAKNKNKLPVPPVLKIPKPDFKANCSIKLSDVHKSGNCPGPQCDLSKFCK